MPKSQTDRQTDKSTRWAFTAYEAQWPLFNDMEPHKDLVAEWGWQREVCPTSGREHYQGFMRTHRQVRFSQIVKAFPGVHVEVARQWDALVNYCRKDDTAVDGTQVHVKSDYQVWSMERLFTEMARYAFSQDRYDELRRDNALKIVDDMEYWSIVRSILTEDSSRVAMFATPQVKKIWANTRSVWIAKQAGADSITPPPPRAPRRTLETPSSRIELV